MFKKFIKVFSILLIILLLFIIYLCIFGIKTNKFNELIKSQIYKIDNRITLDLDEVFVKLNIIEKSISINSKNLKFFILEQNQNIANVDLLISFKTIFKKENKIKKLIINSEENEIKSLLQFIRTYKINIPVIYLENSISEGNIKYDVVIFFEDDNSKKIEVTGKIKNAQLSLLDKSKFKNINLNFNYIDKNLKLSSLSFKHKNIGFNSNNIFLNIKKNLITVKGDLENKISLNLISEIFPNNFKKFFDGKKLYSANSKFMFIFTDKLKIKDYNLESEIFFDHLDFKFESNQIKKYIKNYGKNIYFKNGKIYFSINKQKKLVAEVNASYILNEKNVTKNFKLNYLNENQVEKIKLNVDLSDNEIFIDQINFQKNDKKELFLNLNVVKTKNFYEIDEFSLFNDKNVFKIKNIKLDNNFYILNFKKIQANYYNKENFLNDILILKEKNNIFFKSKDLDISTNIEKNLKNSENSNFLKLFKNLNLEIHFDIKSARIDDEHNLKNLTGKSVIKNNKVYKVNLSAKFDEINNFTFTKDQIDGKMVTTIFSDIAKPFIKKFNFVKGFEGGKLDFTSTETNAEISKSELRIYDFKLRDMPALTKLLSLASLQGIADLATGEGIRFNEFDMFFDNSNNLITIHEIYALGPAISILMEGYVEKNKLVSLRGTLVPATTINKTIAKIPLLGSILVGDKVGEGVFGVSFKIKGPPKNLDTSVNPIKTLTPRFITRTLNKIKKTN